MAFAESVGGERYNLRTGNVVPKRVSAAYKILGPKKWDLVKLNTTNDQVDQCAAGDVPYGFVFSITGGQDIVSVLEWRDNTLLAEYNGAIAVGNKVVADGSVGTILIGGFLRDRVKVDNVNGLATVINKDVYITGTVLVRNG